MIWVAFYRTESGDEGILGYFKRKPSEGELTALFQEEMPDEFIEEADGKVYRYVWWDVWELEYIRLPKPVDEVESI